MDTFQEFVFLRTYARWIPEEERRETWPETVERYCNYLFSAVPRSDSIPEKVKTKIRDAILSMTVMPSMRLLWSAGGACDATNAAAYNCSAVAIDSLESFGEALLNLMAGTGVGFSVERRYIEDLPTIVAQRNKPVAQHVIEDSKFGWQTALVTGLRTWSDGRDVIFDYSKIRPAGARLKTMGGRSSGPEVLRDMLNSARQILMSAQGRQLRPLECHDLMMDVARCVIAGGTRRSAMVSLSDLDDQEMRDAKIGQFDQKRFGANNSSVFRTKPDVIAFMEEFAALAKSGTGERGIFNLEAARKNAPHRRKSKPIALINPCGEVTLRNREFCNLSEVIMRPGDTFEDIRERVVTAAWLGVLQGMLVDFPGLSPEWTANCVEEHLCGVSLTGQMDIPSLCDPTYLDLWKSQAVATGRKAAKIMGVNTPAAMTCCKPSGTVSSLVGCSAGLHPRWAPYYLRNILIAKTDPLCALMLSQGAPAVDSPDESHSIIVSFPMATPAGAATRLDVPALDQMEHYKKITQQWCEMNASCTITVRPEEWLAVCDWVYRNWDIANGLSFYPNQESAYSWEPFQEVTKEEYERAVAAFPTIDFSRLSEFESEDTTEATLECGGGRCEV